MIEHRKRARMLGAAACLWAVATAAGQDAESDTRLRRLEEAFRKSQEESQRAQNENVENRLALRALQQKVEDIAKHNDVAGGGAGAAMGEDRVRAIVKEMFNDPAISKQLLGGKNLEAGYNPDNAYQGSKFFIRSLDDKFELNIGGRMQARYFYYNQLRKNYRDGAKNEQKANTDVRSDFAISRFRINLGGHLFSKNHTFGLELDSSTQNEDGARLHTAWYNWNVTRDLKNAPDWLRDAFQIRVGQFHVPFNRETSSSHWGARSSGAFQLIERNMVAEYFRHGRAPGVELHGFFGGLREGLPDRPGARGFFEYHASISNGFGMAGRRYGADTDSSYREYNLEDRPRETDKYPTLVLRGNFDILKSKYVGEDGLDYYWFGRNEGDLEYHDSLALQAGGGFAWSRIRSQRSPSDDKRLGLIYHREEDKIDPEDSDSDKFPNHGRYGSDMYRLTADMAAKWKGFSIQAEYHYLFLNSNERSGLRSNQNQSAQGFYVQGGYFWIPHTFETFACIGGIFAPDRPNKGSKGKAHETDGSSTPDSYQLTFGFNYYPFHSNNLKFSMDASYLKDPILSSSRGGFVASSQEEAWQIRGQLQLQF